MKTALPDTNTSLQALVSFKWLMAGRGVWVDVPRLRQDEAYALTCVKWGVESDEPVLKQTSASLLQTLLRAESGRANS